MKKTELATKAGQILVKTKLGIKKHSPEILVATGIGTGIIAAIIACKQTIKANDIIAVARENLQHIENAKELAANNEVEYTEEDEQADRETIGKQITIGMVKTYALPVGLGILSITCILAGHHILKKRNVALAAAYSALSTDFMNYRKRVVDKYGKDVDFMLKNGLEKQIVANQVVDPETGEVKETKEEVLTYDGDKLSQYARIFDEVGSTQWTPSADHNRAFLLMEQNYFNERIRTRGYIFLNEVYERLGFRPTKAGSIVGWVYQNADYEGIDFGIFTAHTQKAAEFLEGTEPSIILDFNVQGDILSLVTEGGVWDQYNGG
jgi:hypothetical protein|nr:MAG TPA: hypothetical protein [Caudoviricetes sp.]